MAQAAFDWTEFHKMSMGRPPRELLRRTIGCFDEEKRSPGVAVDLGCGAGVETMELIRRGWHVHAVDSSSRGIELLEGMLPSGARPQFTPHVANFETFDFPDCDLVWAGYSWPYCTRGGWQPLWQRMTAATRPGGRIAGDCFGEKHAWAGEPEIHTVKEQDLRLTLAGLILEAFDIEDGVRPTGDGITRWHAFGIAVRKP